MGRNHDESERNPLVDAVASQYERWPYPAPVDDLTTSPRMGADSRYWDLRDCFWMYWPKGRNAEPLDILVAGCGSDSAAGFAYLYPQHRVVGIDVCAQSLQHEEKLKAKHNLQNLSLRRCPIEEVASLEMSFDYIACTGVLHHMADPTAGLRELGKTLRPDGVADLMLYGKYPRSGVYMFQQAFQLLGLEQTEADLQVVKEVLKAVWPEHPVRRYLNLAIDLNADAGLVDTFLHRRDRPYTVADCLELVREAGLSFGGWRENALYFPDLTVRGTPLFRQNLAHLKDEDVWQTMELAMGNIGNHFFHAFRPPDAANHHISFQGETFLDYIPIPRSRVLEIHTTPQPQAIIGRQPLPPLALTVPQTAVFLKVDAQRTIRQCLQAAGAQGELTEFARSFFGSLWRSGLIMFRLR